MKMYIAGAWTNGQSSMDVLNPYDGSVVDTGAARYRRGR